MALQGGTGAAMVELTVRGEARYRTVDEARIAAHLALNGWAFDLRSAGRERAEREAAAALDGLVMLGLPYTRAPDGRRLFDPVEVSNFLRRTGLAGSDSTLRARCAPSARRIVLDAPSAAPTRYAVTIRRRFNLAGRAVGERVRLRLPMPLADGRLDEVETEFLPSPDGSPAEVSFSRDRVDVSAVVPASGEITVGVRARFVARSAAPSPRPAALDPAERDLYTRASEGLVRVDERVRALALRLAGGETDPWVQMRRFWAFLMDELACGAVRYDAIDAADPYRGVLEDGWYDCKLGSALLVALCRARGLPARIVNGYMLYPVAPAFHTWAEAWIEGAGWLPFDLFSWDLAVQTAGRSWRDFFFGRLDHRMATERPPRLFAGTGDVRLPPAWQMLTYPDDAGAVAEFTDLHTGALVYAEHVAVERLGPVTPRS
jgi:transglutaminase-like putative cysteine protease